MNIQAKDVTNLYIPAEWLEQAASAEDIAQKAEIDRVRIDIVGKLGDLGVSFAGHRAPFTEVRLIEGEHTDWLVAPQPPDLVAPRHIQRRLEKIAQRVDFPLTYVAHECPQGIVATRDGALEYLVPAETSELSERLGRAALGLFKGIAIAPVVVAAAIGGAMAQLDPIVYGVQPVAGGTAVWFELARWVR